MELRNHTLRWNCITYRDYVKIVLDFLSEADINWKTIKGAG